MEHGCVETSTNFKLQVTSSSQTDPTDSLTLRRSRRLQEKRLKQQGNADIQYDYGNQGGPGESVYTNSYKRSDKKSAIEEHQIKHNHRFNFIDFNILYKDSSQSRLKIKETLAIMALNPDLNGTIQSTPLIIFPEGLKYKNEVKFKT